MLPSVLSPHFLPEIPLMLVVTPILVGLAEPPDLLIDCSRTKFEAVFVNVCLFYVKFILGRFLLERSFGLPLE